MDKAVFFKEGKNYPRYKWNQRQVDGLNYLLDHADKLLTGDNKAWKLAYILATVEHETAGTFQPITEYGNNKAKKYYPYHGRGYVQITWKENYQKLGEIVGVDLVQYPDKALLPEIAIVALFQGMQEGWYGPKGLDGYYPDWVEARRTVNVQDKAAEIAKLAQKWLRALNASGWAPEATVVPELPPLPEPVEPAPEPPQPLPKPIVMPPPMLAQPKAVQAHTVSSPPMFSRLATRMTKIVPKFRLR